jgi:hypothetical protein
VSRLCGSSLRVSVVWYVAVCRCCVVCGCVSMPSVCMCVLSSCPGDV